MVIKYGITTGVVALVFAAGFMAGRDTTASAQGNRVFEIRTYTTESKAGLDALVSRMGGGESQALREVGYEQHRPLRGGGCTEVREHLRLHRGA